MNETMVERYKKLYAGVVYDAMTFDVKVAHNFMISKDVKPCWPFKEVVLVRHLPVKANVCSTRNILMIRLE